MPQTAPGLTPLPGADAPPAKTSSVFDAAFADTSSAAAPGLTPLPRAATSPFDSAFERTPQTAPAPSGSPFDAAFGSPSPGLRPLPGMEQRQPSNENVPWYSRVWDAANTPLTTTLFGWGSHREGATGWEKGLEDFASSFTSPLSLALLIGSMGSSALFESGGAAALRAAGMGAEEVSQAARGTEVIAQAVKAGKNSAEALQAAGISPNLMSKAMTTLRAAGMTSESMATHGLFGGATNSTLRAMGVSLSKADKIGKVAQLAADAGFTVPQAWQAVQDSPRLLDALKEGDDERAKELLVHVVLGGGMAALGGKKLLKDAGSSLEDFGAKYGLAAKMTPENQKLRDLYGIYQADKTQAQRAGKIISDELREKYDELDKTDREAVFYLIQSGRDPEVLAKRLNLLAEAAGRDDAKVPEPAPQPFAGPAEGAPVKVFHGTGGEGPLDIAALDAAKYSQARGGAGIANYISTDPNVASQYVAQAEGAKTIAGVLHPNVRLLNATEPLPADVAPVLAKAFTRLAQENFPGQDAGKLFERFNAESEAARGTIQGAAQILAGPRGKPLNDPSLTYIEMIDATRRMLSGARGDVRDGLIKFQSALAREGYEGVDNVYPDRPVIALFPKEVTRRGIEEILKPASPVRQLTADEAKMWNTDEEAAQIEREARYRELAGKQRLANSAQYQPKEIAAMLAAYRRAYDAASASPADPRLGEMRLLAKDLGSRFAESLEKAQSKGVIRQGIRDYVTQLWEKPEENPTANVLLHESRNGGFTTNVSMARHRMFESAFEGQLLGRKLAVTDPITLVGNHVAKVGQAVAARDFMERLVDKNVRASDGRPLVALAGHGQLVEGENGKNPAVLVNPDRIRNVRIADVAVEQLKKSGDLDRLIEEGKIISFKGAGNTEHYLWNTHDYQTIDHSAFHDWNFGAQAPDGTPVMVKSELRVHPQAYEYLNRLIGKQAEQGQIKKALLGVGSEAKHLTLSLSPFHIFQEALRAVMTGVSPFGVEKWDLRGDPTLYKLVRHGMTLGKDSANVQDFGEGMVASGHSKILGRIPLVRDIQNWMQTFLFDKYIPGLKARAGKALYDRYLKAATDADGNFKPGWSVERVAQTAAEDTNERFGGINYKQLGRSAATQDVLRLTTLAPDWLESEMRFAKRAFTGGTEGTIARRDMLRMAAGLWITARVLNYLTTGQAHNEAPFGVAIKGDDGREKIYSIRTMPTDMLHMMSDPVDFLRGRMSPLGKIGTELYTGRDRFGRKLTPFQQIVDVTRGNLPIPLQLVGQAATGTLPSGLTNVDQAVKAAGFTAMPYKTEAEKLASQLASDRMPSGTIDPEQLQRHQAKIAAEDALHRGEQPDLQGFTRNERLEITRGARMSPRAAKAARLPMREFLQVWDAATAQERVELTAEFLKKKRAYMRKAYNAGPEARAKDRVYQRLVQMFAEGAPALPSPSSSVVSSQPPRSPFDAAFEPTAAPGLTPLPGQQDPFR